MGEAGYYENSEHSIILQLFFLYSLFGIRSAVVLMNLSDRMGMGRNWTFNIGESGNLVRVWHLLFFLCTQVARPRCLTHLGGMLSLLRGRVLYIVASLTPSHAGTSAFSVSKLGAGQGRQGAHTVTSLFKCELNIVDDTTSSSAQEASTSVVTHSVNNVFNQNDVRMYLELESSYQVFISL